jgi:hypothetical protein
MGFSHRQGVLKTTI